MKNNPTIKDIAEALKMHHTTVSRALRNHPDVNKNTRNMVLRKAEEMNYIPNTFASGLRNNTSKVIGIMVPDIRPHFFSQTLSYFTNIAFNTGYSVMICQSNEDYEVEKQNTLALLQNRVAGIIASVSYTTKKYDHFIKLEEQGIPVVFFDRVPNVFSESSVKVDVHNGSILAVDHLVSKGKKTIAFYAGNPDILVFKERQSGYREALMKNKIKVDESLIIYGGIEETDGITAAENFLKLKRKPDAIICAVDKVALGMLYTFRKNNIHVPDNIAVIGFDNDPAGNVVSPRLTTLAHPLETLARKSFDVLFERIKGTETVQSVLLDMELIIRESA